MEKKKNRLWDMRKVTERRRVSDKDKNIQKYTQYLIIC